VGEEILLERALGDLVGMQRTPFPKKNLDGCLVECHGRFEMAGGAASTLRSRSRPMAGKSEGFPLVRRKGITLECLQ